jgi:hypothetical protein
MKRTFDWIVTWLAAVCLLLSFALAAHRGADSRGARVKRWPGPSGELLLCRILSTRFERWIPSRAGPHQSFPVPNVFLMMVADRSVATGPPGLDYRGPPGNFSGARGELHGCGPSRQPKKGRRLGFHPKLHLRSGSTSEKRVLQQALARRTITRRNSTKEETHSPPKSWAAPWSAPRTMRSTQ